MIYLCNFLCLVFLIAFTVILTVLIIDFLKSIIDSYEEEHRQKIFMSKRDKFRFKLSYFKEKYKQFKLHRYFDERILAICYNMLCQGNVKFTIDCLNIIIARDVMFNYKVNKLFNKRKLKKVIRSFKLEPKYTYEELMHLDHRKILDTPTLFIISEIQKEVRSNKPYVNI